MNNEFEYYTAIGQNLKNAQQSQMFGKPCMKIEGKAFACFFQNDMVFKLGGIAHVEALKLEGSKLFDPSGKNRPMKEWIQVGFKYKDKWEAFANAALKYVKGSK